MPYKTQTGRRPDLEAIPDPMMPFDPLADLIYPRFKVAQKAGTLYYRAVTAESAVDLDTKTTS